VLNWRRLTMILLGIVAVIRMWTVFSRTIASSATSSNGDIRRRASNLSTSRTRSVI
jgi:uncharacterized membrane protein